MIHSQLKLFQVIDGLPERGRMDVAFAATVSVTALFSIRFPELVDEYLAIAEGCDLSANQMFAGLVARANKLFPDSEDCPDGGPALQAAEMLLYLVEACTNPESRLVMEVFSAGHEAVCSNEHFRRHPESLLGGYSISVSELREQQRKVENSPVPMAWVALAEELLRLRSAGASREQLRDRAIRWASENLKPVDIRKLIRPS